MKSKAIQACIDTRSTATKSPNVKPLTFADVYGLGLMTRSSNAVDWDEIFTHLSPQAKKVAKAVSTKSKATKKIKAAPKTAVRKSQR